MNYDPVGMVGLVVGVVGVLFGWKQYVDMKTTERRAEEANKRLREITERLKTSEDALNLANNTSAKCATR